MPSSERYTAASGACTKPTCRSCTRAAVIVAPHGSGLFGLAATAPQACVVEFFPERYLNLCYAAVARKLDRTYRGLLIDAAGDAELAALPGVLDECVLRRRNATRGM